MSEILPWTVIACAEAEPQSDALPYLFTKRAWLAVDEYSRHSILYSLLML
jgi:hypothetical protein